MKKLKALSVFVVCLLFVSFQSSATGVQNSMNDYKIEEVDNLIPGKDVAKAWTLTYNDSQTPVNVMKRVKSDCIYYVVNTEFFEVCYKCT